MVLREDTFNQALGAVLRNAKPRWRTNPESILVEEQQMFMDADHEKKRPDLLVIDAQSPPVVLECSFSPSDADKDASSRLGIQLKQGGEQLETAIALHIPQSFRNHSLDQAINALGAGEILRYALYQRGMDERTGKRNPPAMRRFPSQGFLAGTVPELAELLDAAALSKEQIERVASDVADLINGSARTLEGKLSEKMQREIASEVYQRTPLRGLRTTMVLWLNALLTQQRLHASGVKGVNPVIFSTSEITLPSRQVQEWIDIQERNWHSVFSPAIRVLKASVNRSLVPTSDALASLRMAVERIETAKLGTHINVGAELFPRLSDDRKQAAAFYTQPASSELLARLTIRECDLSVAEWKSARIFREHTLADLACGTGTLLRSGYRRICSLHERMGGNVQSVRVLHQDAMEHGLIGTDISPVAAYLTASSLAAIGLGRPYGETRIGWVKVGGKTGLMGSLEFLLGGELQNLLGLVGRSRSGSAGDGHSIHVPDSKIDWIMMNPPYSRTRKGQRAFDVAGLADAERKECQKRWGEANRGTPASKKAGMASSFVVLARQKVRLGGRIGFVLPLTAAHADSWSGTRMLIEQEFEDIVALSTGGSLSADTDMEEMLLVATRRGPSRGDPVGCVPSPIHSVTLYDRLERIPEAAEIGRSTVMAIEKCRNSGDIVPIKTGNDEVGFVRKFETSGEGVPWSAVGVQHAALGLAASELVRGHLNFGDFQCHFPARVKNIGCLFTVGPTHDRIGSPEGGDGRGAFKFFELKDDLDALGPDRALWRADSKRQKCIEVIPTHKGVVVADVGSEEEREAMRKYTSTLFYARNMRWTSQSLLAATTGSSALGGRAWVALGHDNIRVRQAFALWANSTLGMISHWTQGQRTQLGRSTTQIGAVKKLPCPRLDQLSTATLEEAGKSFDRLRKQPLRPACQAHCDPVRIEIDRSVVRILDLPVDAEQAIASLRWLWCNEVSVHGENQSAKRYLEHSGSHPSA